MISVRRMTLTIPVVSMSNELNYDFHETDFNRRKVYAMKYSENPVIYSLVCSDRIISLKSSRRHICRTRVWTFHSFQ